MQRILIIVATVALTSSAVRAEDPTSSNSPASSERGPNFPSSQRGPEFPAVPSNQGPAPSFGTTAPAPESRDVPLQAQPEKRSYPSEREIPAQPER